MKDFINFPILIIDDELESDTAGGRALREIIEELKKQNFSVIEALKGNDGKLIFLSHPNISCILIDWYLGLEVDDDYPFPLEIIKDIKKKNGGVPIYLITDKLTTQKIPNDVFKEIAGYIWKTEDTPNFIAGRIEASALEYLENAYPPFFKGLVDYVDSSKYSWHTPGHSGGVAFLKTTCGRLFFEFFGENTLRSDLSVSAPELGSLLEHTKLIEKSEKFAAKVFGADKTYFVTNGTSTANKIVFHSAVSSGDIVLVDRNCHKSIMHALIMTGARPIYLIPTRNHYGIIGPIPLKEFNNIKEKLGNDKAKLVVITNSTYDGLCYNVDKIVEKLKDQVEVFHFDEAWYAYARFHDLYKNRYAMAMEQKEENNRLLIFSTQSTHKLLAAFSQASMIHVKGNIEDEEFKFNEAFMMHTSTSPQYGIIASLDVSTGMMKESGTYLIEEAIEEAIIFRKKMVDIKNEIGRDENEPEKWWFSIWQPEAIKNINIEKASGNKRKSITESGHWFLEKNDEDINKNTWHGFKEIEDDDYIMLDPIKVTVLTPGLKEDGTFESEGIPACVVARFLRKRGIVVEKTGLYSFLVLFSIGITKGKSGSLISVLQEFKKLFDERTPLENVFPEIIENLSADYRTMDLKKFCQAIHDFYKDKKIIEKTGKVYHEDTVKKCCECKSYLIPSKAYEKLVRNEAELVYAKRDSLKGRVSAVMLVPYPPGIPIIMPGECFVDEILDYMETLLEFNKEFRDFEIEIHGLVNGKDHDHKVYCVINEST
jgi:lysine decarboxylase/arginine decarboxylase